MLLIFPGEAIQDRPMGDDPSDRIGAVAAILRTLSEGKSPIIAVHWAKAARTRLLDDLVPALGLKSFRVIQVMSLDGVRIDLNSLMDQVVGHGCVDVFERSERCHAALTAPGTDQVVLIVDDAQLLADQALHYLDLVTSIGRLTLTPPHIVLFGSADLWERLPKAGNLASAKAALRIAIPDDIGEADQGRPDSLPFGTADEGATDAIGIGPVTAEVEGPAIVQAAEGLELAAIAEPRVVAEAGVLDEVRADEVPAPIDVVAAGEEPSAVEAAGCGELPVIEETLAIVEAGALDEVKADEAPAPIDVVAAEEEPGTVWAAESRGLPVVEEARVVVEAGALDEVKADEAPAPIDVVAAGEEPGTVWAAESRGLPVVGEARVVVEAGVLDEVRADEVPAPIDVVAAGEEPGTVWAAESRGLPVVEEARVVVEAGVLDEVRADEVPAPIDVVAAGEDTFAVHEGAAGEDPVATHTVLADEDSAEEARDEIHGLEAGEPAPSAPAVQFAASEAFDKLRRPRDVAPQVSVAVEPSQKGRERAEMPPPAAVNRRWGVMAASVGLIVVGGGLVADRQGLIQTHLFDRIRGVEAAQARGADTWATAQSAAAGAQPADAAPVGAGVNAAEPTQPISQGEVSGAGTSAAGDLSHAGGEPTPQATLPAGTDRSNAAAPSVETPDHSASVNPPMATTATPAEANRPEPTPTSPAAVEAPTETKTVQPLTSPVAVAPQTSSATTEPPTSPATVESPRSPATVEPPTSPATVEPPKSPAAVEPPKSPAAVEPPTSPAAVEPPKSPAAVEPPTETKTVAAPPEPPPPVAAPNPPSDAGANANAQPVPPAAVSKPERVASPDTSRSAPAVSAAPPAKSSVDAPANPVSGPAMTGSSLAAGGPVAPPVVSSGVVTLLVTRGDALLATGDVSAARLMYQRAAQSNSAPGALAMGKTYDPQFLAGIGARGIAADPKQAAAWYQRAADMGSQEAIKLLTEPRGK